MDAIDIEVINTQNFVWPQDVSAWAMLYPLRAGSFRAQMRLTAIDPVVQYEWSTVNGGIFYSEAPASGSVVYTVNPSPGDFFGVGTTLVELVADGATGLQVDIGLNAPATLAALVAFLAGSSDPQLKLCSYSLSGLTVNAVAQTLGVVGNSIALTATTAGSTPSGPTLANGAATVTMIGPLGETEGFLGDYVYDCRWEYQGAEYDPLFGGNLTFDQGVTREPTDSIVSANTIPSAAYAATQPSLINALVFA